MAAQPEERKILGLEETAKNVIIRSLGELADSFSSKFCCGGNVMVQDIRINYKQARDGSEVEVSELVLPGADENAMSQFLAASSVASFGKGTEEIVDPSYRDAYKFDPDTMTTSFDLSNTSILTDIEALMVPNRRIRAELHKLNIYTSPNGHFKSHVDTPRSGEMFGSLVVCFPTQFTGGVLAARHQGQEVTFDWSTSYSSSPTPCTQLVHWAAFFSDVEHEILPVTSGYRITLTYNLYTVKEMASEIFAWTPFYQYLQETLKNPQFMPAGGCLGFDCTHAYVFNHLNEKQLLPSVLKGADYMVFSVAKSLGLNVSVKPIVEGYEYWYLLPEFSKVFGKSHAPGWDPEDYHPPTQEMLESIHGHLHQQKAEHVYEGITWCRAMPTWQDVLKQISNPIKTTADMLERDHQLEPVYKILQSEYLTFYEYRFKSVNINEDDIPLIIDALKKLQPKYKRIYRPIGAFTYMGNEPINDIHVSYQSAIILVDVPHWVNRSSSHRIQSPYADRWRMSRASTDTKNVLFWSK